MVKMFSVTINSQDIFQGAACSIVHSQWKCMSSNGSASHSALGIVCVCVCGYMYIFAWVCIYYIYNSRLMVLLFFYYLESIIEPIQ